MRKWKCELESRKSRIVPWVVPVVVPFILSVAAITQALAEPPGDAVTIEAATAARGVLTYNGQIRPIFEARCAACHNGNPLPNWLDYSVAYAERAKIREHVFVLKDMPFEGSPQAAAITAEERKMIADWVDEGAPEDSPAPQDSPAPRPSIPAPPASPPAPVSAAAPTAPQIAPLSPADRHQVSETLTYCAWCHSRTGARPISPAPKLAGQQEEYLVDQIRNFKSHKRDNPYSRENMWGAARAVPEYLIPAIARFFSSQKIWPTQSSDSAMIAKGKAIYEGGVPSQNVMACVACHGANGHGGAAVPRLASQDKYYIRRQLREWREGYRAYAAPMPMEAKGLTEDDIEAVSDYVSSLQ